MGWQKNNEGVLGIWMACKTMKLDWIPEEGGWVGGERKRERR